MENRKLKYYSILYAIITTGLVAIVACVVLLVKIIVKYA